MAKLSTSSYDHQSIVIAKIAFWAIAYLIGVAKGGSNPTAIKRVADTALSDLDTKIASL